MSVLKKKLLLIIGLFSFGLGYIGVLLPILPTTPFLLLSLYCFTSASPKFEKWLKGTRLYQRYLGEYLETGSLSLTKKWKILLNIYILMGISIYFAPIRLVKIMLTFLTIGLTLFLFFFIPTRRKKESPFSEEQEGE